MEIMGREQSEGKDLYEMLADTKPIGELVKHVKTLDLAQAMLTFIDVIAEKTLSFTVTLTVLMVE